MKKIIPYILILIALIGMFIPFANTYAQNTLPTCTFASSTATTPQNGPAGSNCRLPTCTYGPGGTETNGPLGTRCAPATNQGGAADQPTAGSAGDNVAGTALERNLKSCGTILYGDFDGCFVKITYYLFNGIPSFFLGLVTQLFNVLVALSLSSTIYSSSFIPEVWGIVRDLSNIFFILVLLYIGVKVILGLGGHDVKKMIVNVIIMALLINFSMFFTKVVVDASNILALIFYNKISVETQIKKNASAKESNRSYLPITDPSKTGIIEKDLSGGLAAAFNPGAMLSDEFFNKARTQTQQITTRLGFYTYLGGGALAGSAVPVVGTLAGAGIGGAAYLAKSTVAYFIPTKDIPVPLMLGIILVNGFIMLFAIYAFFTAAWAFLGRIIELWVLMIFSPFAFMSFSIPLLGHIEYIGWDAWLKRLFQVAFMAPVFMFFMYFIFKIVNANIFNSLVDRINFKDQGTVEAILLLTIPALLICVLLKKAADYAQKASGVIGQTLTKTAGVVTGAVAGGVVGLGARGLQGSLGHIGKRVFEDKTLTEWEANGKGWRRAVGSGLRSIGGGDDGKGGLAGSSFDARKGIVGGGLKLASTVTGINFGSQSKLLATESGGYVADLAKRDAKRKKRAEGLKVKEGEDEKQKLNEAEEGKHNLTLKNTEEIHKLTDDIAGAESNRDAYQKLSNSQPDNEEAKQKYMEYAAQVITLKAQKSEVTKGGEIMDAKGEPTGVYRTSNGAISESYWKGANQDKEKADSSLAAVEASKTGAETAHATALAAKASAEASAEAAKAAKERAETEAKFSVSGDASISEAIKEATRAEEEAAARVAAASEDVASKLKDVTTANQKLTVAQKKATEAAARAKRANEAKDKLEVGPDGKPKFGKSMNDFDHTIPHLKHEIEKINHHRLEGFAKGIEQETSWWNKAARKKSAHEIRMGIKAEKHDGGGHGSDHGGILDELALAYVTAKIVDDDHGHAAPAADHGGGHDDGGHGGGGGSGHGGH